MAAARTSTRTGPDSRVSEAIAVARGVLAHLDKGGSVATALRQCERLASLIDDKFMTGYGRLALQPGLPEDDLREALRVVSGRRDPEASGMYRFLEDFQVSGIPLGRQLTQKSGEINIGLHRNSVAQAETLIASGRKNIKYTVGDRALRDSVEEAELCVERVRNRLYRYASRTLDRLVLERVPEAVLEGTRHEVDAFLAANIPEALEKFRVAYDELRGESAENWTNACTAVRRILLDVADSLFPPRDEPYEGRDVGPDKYVNRLWARAHQKVASGSQRATVGAEAADLGARIDAIYAQSNKGVHAVVSRDEAERVIARAYLLIADLI